MARHVPAGGSVHALVGYAAFALAVDAAGPTLAATLDARGVLPAATTATALAGLLWVLLALTVLGVLQRQARERTRRRERGRDATDVDPPTPTRLGLEAALACVALAVAWRAWPAFATALVRLAYALPTPGEPVPLDALAVVVGVGVVLAVLAWSADRAVVGALRWALSRSR
ncbi:hypothetical protein EFA46_002310 [Halarchaeum sp. CBA1220]|uniref:hypothetical protein n=1 Tax=Halarchaeum sp. CBA1220 TaxID=1853682 RepID=UPI000F3A9589|nr:hypothetical protein [Halarchaeum sp. CBA1220]QLC33087.1 hypothetical protein EFA46_002310 [Halarchaeum sp. CBA1220]